MMKHLFRLMTGILLGILLTPGIAFAQELLDLSEGMTYADARQALIDTGWQPTVTRDPDRPLMGTVARMVNELGYDEVVDCSGTGRGFCLFSFTNADDEKLSVTTVNNQQGQEPTVAGWRLEE